MARILDVYPGRGGVEDDIRIKIEYDPLPGPSAPRVNHVLFHDRVSADFDVRDIDAANSEMNLIATVPSHATTGPIWIEFSNDPNGIHTFQDFTVTDPIAQPARVSRVLPGRNIPRGGPMTIVLSTPIGDRVTVYFPGTDYGPPSIRARNVTVAEHLIRVAQVPDRAATGRVKVQNVNATVLTRVLTFV